MVEFQPITICCSAYVRLANFTLTLPFIHCGVNLLLRFHISLYNLLMGLKYRLVVHSLKLVQVLLSLNLGYLSSYQSLNLFFLRQLFLCRVFIVSSPKFHFNNIIEFKFSNLMLRSFLVRINLMFSASFN